MSLIFSKSGDSVTLPSPDWQDSYSIVGAMNIHQSMSQATVYSYTKRSSLIHRTFIISNIDYALLEDLQDFLTTYAGQNIDITATSSLGIIAGKILNDPTELVTEKRGYLPEDCSDSEDYTTHYDKEGMTITFEYEGT